MLDGLFIVSLVGTIIEAVKEKNKPIIPSKNWNMELWNEDLLNNVPIEKRMNKVRSGKYKTKEVYNEPHRDLGGKIIIENTKLYYDDCSRYGALQAQKWVQQGKYNLSYKELEKEEKRIKDELEYLLSL